MSDFIETPTIGEILNEEFLIPLGISAYKLAQEIKVPTSRIQDILHNRRKITVDTSLRLAKFLDYLTAILCLYRMISISEMRRLNLHHS